MAKAKGPSEIHSHMPLLGSQGPPLIGPAVQS